MNKGRLRAGMRKVVALHRWTLFLSVLQSIVHALVFYSHAHEVIERPLASAFALLFCPSP